ncbi:MAG TPA: aminofutalosine synthase MqnE [bacterium]|nr:aminofutalosine synthase MqnE [bacterium]
MALKRLLDQSPIKNIYDKVEAGTRITDEDALRLYKTNDMYTLGAMANIVRERKNGNNTYYNKNRHIDYSNVCSTTCKFCAFSRFEGEEGAFEFTHQQLAAKAREAYQLEGITELHIVGGLHPTYTFEWYEEMLRVLKAAVPGIHLKCFTGVEINFFAEKYNMTHEEILTRLKAAGLGSMPGGGAEIFHPDVREEICPGKGNAEQWLTVHRTAHRLGMRTNATMLYGHIETYEHRVDHMSRLRKLQDETGGFQTFIPLAFHPDHTQMDHFARPSGVEDLKTLAIGRVYLDNFDHIKAYWISMGVRLAQMSLAFGVDDIDGTVIDEKIYRMAGADSPEVMTAKDLQALIRDAGRMPVERDTLYKELKPMPEVAAVK